MAEVLVDLFFVLICDRCAWDVLISQRQVSPDSNSSTFIMKTSTPPAHHARYQNQIIWSFANYSHLYY